MWPGSWKLSAGAGGHCCLKEVCFGSPTGPRVLGSPQKPACSIKANCGYYDAITSVSCGMLKTQENCAPGEGRRKNPRET